MELAGSTAAVTGASAGIGRGIARIFAAEGVNLVLVARRQERLDALADELAETGAGRPLVAAVDLTAAGAAELIRDRVAEAFGRLDILINSAGGSRPLPVEASDAEWDEAFALNFTALRRLTHAVLPLMKNAGRGRIVNITGSLEPKGLNAANAAKAAVHAWAKGLSRELGPRNITVNCISPGRIMSEQVLNHLHPTDEERRRFAADHIPLGYFGEPEDIGYLVALLASPKGRYITGELIHVDGGLRRFAF